MSKLSVLLILLVFIGGLVFTRTTLNLTQPTNRITTGKLTDNLDLEWNYNDSQIVMATSYGITIFDVESGKQVKTLEDTSKYKPLNYSIHQHNAIELYKNYVASNYYVSPDIRIWDVNTKQRHTIIEIDNTDGLMRATPRILDMDWTEEDLLISTNTGNILLYDVGMNTTTKVLDLEGGWLNQVVWRNNHQFYYSIRNTIKLYDLRTSTEIESITIEDYVYSLDLSQNVITIGSEGEIIQYDTDLSTETLKITLEQDYYEVIYASMHPTEEYLLVLPRGNNAIVYDTTSRGIVGKLHWTGNIQAEPTWSHSGEKIAYDNGQIFIWSTTEIINNFKMYNWIKYGVGLSLIGIPIIFQATISYLAYRKQPI